MSVALQGGHISISMRGLLLCWIFTLGLMQTFQSADSTAQFAWTNIQTSVTRGQVDLWTATSSGCTCSYDVLDHNCACCVLNGCHCGQSSPQRCGQCGLEQHCDNMCNITISAREILSRSGQTFGEIKSPSTLSGPSSCWYRLKPEQNQRVEIQIYRIKRLGRLNPDSKRCTGGFLQLIPDTPNPVYNPSEVSICGANERYSPPIVLFGESAGVSSVLLFRIDESTSLSQFLAHYSFTPIEKEETGFQIKGGIKVMPSTENGNSDCDWRFEERHCQAENTKGGCQLATPGYPGIYPPNRRCRYYIEATTKNTQIRLTFRNINLPQEECDSDKVNIYQGSTSSSPLIKSFCGFAAKEKVLSKDGDTVLVEFNSGSVLPPFNYNGFVAKIEFLPKDAKGSSGQNSNPDSNSGAASSRRDPPSDSDDADENEEENYDEEVSQKEETVNRKQRNRNKKLSSSNTQTNTGGNDSKCQVEYLAEESRTGIIRSSDLNLKQKKCSLLFKGNPGDVLLVKLNTYKLRGKSCESYITISARRRNQREQSQSEVFEHICSPATRRQTDQNGRFVGRPPILINSSFVSLDYQAHKSNVDRFEVVYTFHHVLSDGLPIPNTTCDSLYPGRTGSSKGSLHSPDPGKSEIFRNWQGPVKCTKSLVPTDSQSLTLKIESANSKPADEVDDRCETQCDERGCRCQVDTDVTLNEVDHVMVTPLTGGGIVACFCGEFALFLPLNVISSSGLSVIYNSVNFNPGSFSYSASYNFHNEETCGPRRVSSPLGSLESPLAASPAQSYHPSSTYFHQECQWFFDPPPSKQLILKISTSQKMDCFTWNATIAIWNTSFPDQIGTIIDKFCPEISAKEYILNTTERKIVISLHSMAPGPIHYRISWETRGLMPRDGIASNVDTKEVIDGAGGYFGTSSGQTSIREKYVLALAISWTFKIKFFKDFF